MIIRHPYTFIPFPEILPRTGWPGGIASGHERYQPGTFSGALDCILTTVSPLCIKEHFGQIHKTGAPPYIPGSSLKGMLRNTMQILGLGCVGQQFQNKKAKEYERKGAIDPLDLGDLTACSKEETCMVCRLFGYGVEKDGSSDDEPFGWAARLRVFDSGPAQDWNCLLYTSDAADE